MDCNVIGNYKKNTVFNRIPLRRALRSAILYMTITRDRYSIYLSMTRYCRQTV